MVGVLTLTNRNLFMTIGPCVVCAWAVCETLTEGTADYCMIVCE